MSTATDFTATGTKIEGNYENDRNAENSDLYKEMVRECYKVTDVIVAHHITYVTEDKRDGFTYQIVQEIPSADALIFDHDIAKKIWGEEAFLEVLMHLACQPISTRDKVLAELYHGRKK